jgi:hypothetical protein
MIPKYVYDKSFIARFPDGCEWTYDYKTNGKGWLIWFMVGSQTSKGMEAGVYGYGTRWKFSFSLGQYRTVFQAEVYSIRAA